MKKVVAIGLFPIFLYSYTLKELIEDAQKNQQVEALSYDIASKQKSYDSIESSYLPDLKVGAMYQNASKESNAIARDSLRADANLKYIIYDGGKKYNLYDKAKLNVDSSQKALISLKNNISLDVARLYFEYLSLLEDRESLLQESKLLEAEYQRLKAFLDVGSTTADEVQKIDSALKSVLVLLDEVELNKQRLLFNLENYTTKDSIDIQNGSSIRLDDISYTNRLDILSRESAIEAILNDAKSIKSANLPTLYANDNLSYTKPYYDDKRLEPNSYIKTQNLATLNLSWSIFDFGTISKNYESRYFDYLSQKSQLEYDKHRADTDYKFAKKALQIAQLKINSTKVSLDAATLAFEYVESRFQNGAVDNVAYLQALSQKYDALRAYKRALNDVEVKKAELIYFSGKDIKEYVQWKVYHLL